MLKQSSVSVAKNRLKALVTSDRVQCLPDSYESICRELYETISKYIEITPENFTVQITQSDIHIQLAGEKK